MLISFMNLIRNYKIRNSECYIVNYNRKIQWEKIFALCLYLVFYEALFHRFPFKKFKQIVLFVTPIVKSCRVWMTIHGPRADLKMYELCSQECNKEIKLII
jgi:hypothetical protein